VLCHVNIDFYMARDVHVIFFFYTPGPPQTNHRIPSHNDKNGSAGIWCKETISIPQLFSLYGAQKGSPPVQWIQDRAWAIL